MTDEPNPERLAEYVDGAPGAEADFQPLLAGDAEVRRAVREQWVLDALLRSQAGALPPPADLAERLRQRLQRGRRRLAATVLAAAAAILVALFAAEHLVRAIVGGRPPEPPGAHRQPVFAIVGVADDEGSDVRVAIADGLPPKVCRVTGDTLIYVDGRWGVIEDLRVGQRVVRMTTVPPAAGDEPETLAELMVEDGADPGQT
jgi:hypothetical protein